MTNPSRGVPAQIAGRHCCQADHLGPNTSVILTKETSCPSNPSIWTYSFSYALVIGGFCSVSNKWCRLSFRQWRVASWDIHCRWQVNILLFASKWNNPMHWHPHAAIKIHGPDHAIANGLILSERYTSHSQHWVFLEVPSQWISQFVRIEVLNSFFEIWSMVASWWPSCLWLLFFCIFQQAVESADLWTLSSSSDLNTPRRPPWQFLLSLRRRGHVKCIRNWLVCYEDEPLFWMSNLETNGFAQHCGFPLHSMGFQFGML